MSQYVKLKKDDELMHYGVLGMKWGVRKKIVEESLGNISADCDGCMAGLAEMYQDYIEGKREIRDINMEFNARYVRGDMDKEERRSCPM